MTCDTGPGHTLLGHAALGDLFSDFLLLLLFFLFVFIVFHLRSCQECGQWDSQAARVTVHHQHHHHQYHHHYCHHHYCHPPQGIIIIRIIMIIIFVIIILLSPQARK